jgi:hypothetical protein
MERKKTGEVIYQEFLGGKCDVVTRGNQTYQEYAENNSVLTTKNALFYVLHPSFKFTVGQHL